MPTRSPLALAACALTLPACQVQDSYLVDRQALLSLANLSAAERGQTVVPAEREKGGRAVLLRAAALAALPPPVELGAGDGAQAVRVSARMRAPMATAGAVLTIVGAACSIVGTAGFLATTSGGAFSSDPNRGFAAVELAGEAQMVVGTVLWIYGLLRPPMEVRPGASGTLLRF
jgi:hypothetical protein